MPSVQHISCFLLLWLLFVLKISPIVCYPQFVETFMDYKKNHIENEIQYAFHYYIDHAPSNLQINHQEERRGTYTHGQYGLLEPNGEVRQVSYEVDKDRGGGFHAIIQTRTAFSRVLQRLHLNGRKQPKEPLRHATLIAQVAEKSA